MHVLWYTYVHVSCHHKGQMPARNNNPHQKIRRDKFETGSDRVVTPGTQYTQDIGLETNNFAIHDGSMFEQITSTSVHTQSQDKDKAEIPHVKTVSCASSHTGAHSSAAYTSSNSECQSVRCSEASCSQPHSAEFCNSPLDLAAEGRTTVATCDLGNNTNWTTDTDKNEQSQVFLNSTKSSVFISKYFARSFGFSSNFSLKKVLASKYVDSIKPGCSEFASTKAMSSESTSDMSVSTSIPVSRRQQCISEPESQLVNHSTASQGLAGQDGAWPHVPHANHYPDSSGQRGYSKVISFHPEEQSQKLLSETRASEWLANQNEKELEEQNTIQRGSSLMDCEERVSNQFHTWSLDHRESNPQTGKDFLVDLENTASCKKARYSPCREMLNSASVKRTEKKKSEPVETKSGSDEPAELPHTSGQWEVVKRMDNGLCQVCGDMAAGFYCGAFVCEACKKFFIRASKQEKQKFVCLRQGNCKITKESRVQCQYCRYQRCLELNMYYPGEGKRSVVRVGIAEIPCRVCAAPSSGFHFGALTCEGCKGFFRRMVKEREPGTYRCSAGGACDISLHTRNMCKACRYQKCISIGMSVEGSRIGRQPNAVKHAISLEVKKKCSETSSDGTSSFCNGLPSNRSAATASTIQPSSSAESTPALPLPVIHIKEEADSNFSFKDMELQEVAASQVMCVKEEPDDFSEYEMTEHSLQAAGVELARIPILERVKADTFDEQAFVSMSSMWKKMMRHFEFHAQCTIRFAKKVPGFRKLPIDDQVALVQHATYPVVILNHARGYELETGFYNYFNFTKREEAVIFEKAPMLTTLAEHFKHTGLIAQTMQMTEMEYILLSCMLLLDSECLGLEKVDEVVALQNRILQFFRMYEERTHETGSSRFGELMLRISELALANVQHLQTMTLFVAENPTLEVPRLYKEMFF